MLRKNYCYSSLEVKNNDKNVYQYLFKATAPKGTNWYISLNRKNIRHLFPDSHISVLLPKYGVNRVICFQVKDNKEIEILNYGFNAKQTCYCDIKVDNPEFYVYVTLDYNESKNLDIILSSYASKPINFEFLEKETEKIRQDTKNTFMLG